MQRRFFTKRALAFVGKNHHAASAQNLQQTPAGFLLRFPKRHRQLLPQDTLYHLVKVGIHSVDLSAAARSEEHTLNSSHPSSSRMPSSA